MSQLKLKLLFRGKPGILLLDCPSDFNELQRVIHHYYHTEHPFMITFKDNENDECEILDQLTLDAAFLEFQNKLTLRISIQQSNPEQNLHQVNPVINGRNVLKYFKNNTCKMYIFDLDTMQIQQVKFPKGVVFKQYATWLDLPSGEVFYAGGGYPMTTSEVYLLNLQDFSYKVLPNMINARHSHGSLYHNGSVYVYGGFQHVLLFSTALTKCEKFNLEQGVWENQPDLESPRGDVAACMDGEGTEYVFGRGSPYLVPLNSYKNPIDLQHDEGGTLCIIEDKGYVFQGQKMRVYNLESGSQEQEHQLPQQATWWSHCPPVVYGGYIYFVYWREPGMVCRFNLRNNAFERVRRFDQLASQSFIQQLF